MVAIKEKILVIRLGALGDLVFCFQSFHEIRQAHPNADIALLTRAAFVPFARLLPWFDHIIIDTHPRFTQPMSWLRLRQTIKLFAPTRIYDLQGKNRQKVLYALLGGKWGVEWSGNAPLCTFPRLWPPRPGMSFVEFLAAQLRLAHIPPAPPPDLSFLDAPIEKFNLPENYVVLVPGCSPTALHKRWPHYGELAALLQKHGLRCILVGTKDDAEAIDSIRATAPDSINLCNQTSLQELTGIFRRAVGVIGNDTGPVHLAAAIGTPILALFSDTSSPAWSKPPGTKSTVLQRPILADLDAKEVETAFHALLQHTKNKG